MKSIIKIFLSLLIGLSLQLSIVYGQDTDSENPLQNGSKALQFQISDNFNLSSFDGTIISYKEQLSEDQARRIGLYFDSYISTIDRPESDQDSESKGLNSFVGINYTWLNYTDPDADIKFYYGYGPGISIGYERTVNENSILEETNQTFSYGIEGIGYAGVEWFFQSSMSLHAEYRASVRIRQSRLKSTTVIESNEDVRKISTTRVDLGGDGVRFGLSVYF